MKHPRRSTSNRGYQLTADAAAFLNQEYPRPYRLTPEGKAEIEKQSHRQEMDEIIDEQIAQEEAEKAKKPLSQGDKLSILMDCSQRLHERFLAFFSALVDEKDFKKRDALLIKCQNVQKASRRVTRKIGMVLEI
jgi:hypothetical protein